MLIIGLSQDFFCITQHFGASVSVFQILANNRRHSFVRKSNVTDPKREALIGCDVNGDEDKASMPQRKPDNFDESPESPEPTVIRFLSYRLNHCSSNGVVEID
jgi:hypothetical protein